jgi:hypothetical protein
MANGLLYSSDDDDDDTFKFDADLELEDFPLEDYADPNKEAKLPGKRRLRYDDGPQPRDYSKMPPTERSDAETESPVGFAIIFGNENGASWKLLWEFLLETHPSMNASDITMITDQDKGQKTALSEVLPNVGHFHCVYHRRGNIIKTVVVVVVRLSFPLFGPIMR